MGIKKKVNMMTLSLIPIAIAINFVGFNIAVLLKLPVYLDSIGTILVGALCGPVIGLITGALSVAINGIFDPINLAYIGNGVVYGLVAGLFGRKGWFTHAGKTLVIGIVIAAIGVAMSTPVTAYLFGGISETGQSVLMIIFQSMGMGMVQAVLISSLIMEMIDKIIVTFVAFFILKAISDRFLSKFPLGELYYKKTYNDEAEE